MQFEIGRTSRLGNREVNQDRLTVLESSEGIIMVLGDGLGGKPGGDLASQTLVNSITETVTLHPLPTDEPERYLHELIRRAHHAVLLAGQEQKPPISPGTTAVVCLIQAGIAWWAHVGDSRFYLFRDGMPLYRTKDHSYVEELYQAGHISLKKTHDHPMRNYVTQCIGLQLPEPKIEINQGVELLEGDILLLCSDGFWEPLDEAQIGVIMDGQKLNDALNALAERAETTSYPRSDNTSAVGVRVTSVQQPGKVPPSRRAQRAKKRGQLYNAISEIEQAIKKYEKEMKK